MNWPDVVDPTEVTPILCRQCHRPTRHALNTNRYVCDVHGPQLTGEALARPTTPAPSATALGSWWRR